MGNILECAQLVGAHIEKAVLECLVGEPLGALGVHHADSVNLKMIGVDIGLGRTYGYCPHTVGTLGHVHALAELCPYLHVLGVTV